jgi:hypothetical protein
LTVSSFQSSSSLTVEDFEKIDELIEEVYDFVEYEKGMKKALAERRASEDNESWDEFSIKPLRDIESVNSCTPSLIERRRMSGGSKQACSKLHLELLSIPPMIASEPTTTHESSFVQNDE